MQLAAEDLLDALAQRRPVALGGIEMASQIEQGALTHFVAEAFGAHEAMGEIGLAGGGGAGLGAADEHGSKGSGGGEGSAIVWIYFMALHRPTDTKNQ